jgi:hypothetical protein
MGVLDEMNKLVDMMIGDKPLYPNSIQPNYNSPKTEYVSNEDKSKQTAEYYNLLRIKKSLDEEEIGVSSPIQYFELSMKFREFHSRAEAQSLANECEEKAKEFDYNYYIEEMKRLEEIDESNAEAFESLATKFRGMKDFMNADAWERKCKVKADKIYYERLIKKAEDISKNVFAGYNDYHELAIQFRKINYKDSAVLADNYQKRADGLT